MIRCVSCDRGVTERGGMCGFCRDTVAQLRIQIQALERRLEEAKHRADEADAERLFAKSQLEEVWPWLEWGRDRIAELRASVARGEIVRRRLSEDLQEAWRWIEYARERITSRFLGGTACIVCFGAKGHWVRDADTLRPVWVICRACDGSGTEDMKRREMRY